MSKQRALAIELKVWVILMWPQVIHLLWPHLYEPTVLSQEALAFPALENKLGDTRLPNVGAHLEVNWTPLSKILLRLLSEYSIGRCFFYNRNN